MASSLVILFLLILAGGFFGFSEISLAAAKRQKLAALSEEGDERAAIALELSKNPNRLLGTTQLGLTFVTLIEGAFAHEAFASHIAGNLPDFEFVLEFKDSISTGIVMFSVTMATIVFGEMLPKRIALLSPEKSAMAVAKIIRRFSGLVFIAISILSWITDRTMSALGFPLIKDDSVSVEDIESMLDAGAKEGLFAPHEQKMLDAVWRMDERSVKSIMTPRSDIAFIDLDASFAENKEVVIEHPGKKLLVCRGGIDKILGVGNREGWLKKLLNGEDDFDWEEGVRTLHGIPDSLNMVEAIESLSKYKTGVAIVYDEFGQVSGMLTFDDIMQSVAGASSDSEDAPLLIIKDGDKWLIDGLAPIADVVRELSLEGLGPENESHFKTAGGFAFHSIGKKKGRLPKEFDFFEQDGYTFRIVDIDRTNGYRVDQIMVERTKKES